MIKLITWEMDRSFFPQEPKDRMKLTMALCEAVKKTLAEGRMKMWGMNPGGNHGFCLADGEEKEILTTVAQFIPHVQFRVEPMLSIDEVIESMQNLLKQFS